MLESWRWYGPQDPISLMEIRQAGARGIVNALHELPCGTLWSQEAIAERKAMIESAGMDWVVVESVAVHEDIKTRSGSYLEYINIYKQTIRHLAACGIRVICYNFMPVLDWTRSNLAQVLPDGSSVLASDADDLALFDVVVLARPGACGEYDEETLARVARRAESMTNEEKDILTRSILLGLPGTVDDLTLDEFRTMLTRYDGIDEEKLRENLYTFLNEIMPVCEEVGVFMAIHPDDPPRPIFGLPRIMSTEEDMERLIREVPSRHSGFTLCTGSLGGRRDNAPHLLMERFADRVFFAHFRNTLFEGENPDSFRESECHLVGHTDMAYAMQALLIEEDRRSRMGLPVPQIPVRPDHGKRMIIDELRPRACYGGYEYGGRLVGLAELRGLAYGLRHHYPLLGKVALVTGAAGVLCSEMARCLLKAGAKVALLGRTESKLIALRDTFAHEGLTQTLVLAADVLDKDALVAAREKLVDHWGKLDILLNGAGGNDPRGTSPAEQFFADTDPSTTFFGTDLAGFDAVNRLNIVGTILPSQVFGELLIPTKGCVVNISSVSATQPLTKVAAYGAAKAAVDHFTRWLSTHLAPLGVRVNSITPGFFITDQNRFLMMQADGETPTPRGQKVLNKTPMHRFGEPHDLCGALKFLVSDEAAFVTGITIPVDGGFLSFSGV